MVRKKERRDGQQAIPATKLIIQQQENGEVNYGIFTINHTSGEILVTEKNAFNTMLSREKKTTKRKCTK